MTLCLGIWLVACSWMFNEQSQAMHVSDVISGLLVVVFSLWSRIWLLCLVGIYLQLAPLLFWAPSSTSYLNDTLIGSAIIVFSILLAKVPGEVDAGPKVPQGWSYNPSSFIQRLPVAFLAFLCFLFSRYMASFQLGYITSVYDPLFDKGTYFVITSNISKAFPVSDAGLGSAAYLIEALMALKGGERRWHTMPWMVALFGFLVVPVGFVSVLLIMLQPLVVGHWCFWCLLTALCMLAMIALTIDEVLASIQYLLSEKPFWKRFFKGSCGDAKGEDDIRTPTLDSSWKTGISLPWNLVFSTLVGIWILFSPAFIMLARSISIESHILGALTVVVSVVAMAEPMRAFRFINVIFGIAFLVSPWLFFDGMTNYWDIFAVGVLLVIFSLPKGKVQEKYGTIEKYIF